MAENWSSEELEAAVGEYMRMLALELKGKTYNKAEVNRRLRNGPLGSRNKASIELRMANISAVLHDHDRKYINGYKPREHVGSAVRDQIAALIERHYKGRSSSTSPSSSTTQFKEAFEDFKRRVVAQPPYTAFVSFSEGLPVKWEGYKPVLRTRALRILDFSSWRAKDVGSGRILDAVISAIEIDENNLVRWPNRFGHRNRSHYKLLDARDQPDSKTHLETLLFDLYVEDRSEEVVFEGLRSLLGNRYDLLAYLFFLKNLEQFMPIAPSVFGRAFRRLGLDLVMSHQCSWENYVRYNKTLTGVLEELIHVGGVDDVRLIDAHSFCWMLEKLPPGSDPDSANKGRNRWKRKRDKGRSLSPMEISISEMVRNAAAAAKGSGGPPVVRQIKKKELRMTESELEAYLHTIVDRQEGKCALTGIPLQGRSEASDEQLLASLDRIDSDGHYEMGNLQVVCRFVNFWKQAEEDDEFRRLLQLVREGDERLGQQR